jgi:hypothetical protein
MSPKRCERTFFSKHAGKIHSRIERARLLKIIYLRWKQLSIDEDK